MIDRHILNVEDVKLWANGRLVFLRDKLEIITNTEQETIALRSKIAAHKELLAALRNDAPPVWNSDHE